VFFSCAAAAQEAGFRPCLRCRPEVSPDTPAWNGSSSTVSRALRLISEGALDDNSVDTLAARVGVGERHLRRLFTEHLGASPVAVAGTQRVLFAKKLLLETALPITEIAFAAGFASVRRFNHVMRDTYQRSPRELRGRSTTASTALTLTLPFRPPYYWTALSRFLALRAIPGVEVVTPEKYARTIRIDNVAGRIEVTPVAGANHLAARIEMQNLRPLARVSDRLRRLFDTGAPVQDIESHLRKDPLLAPLVKAQPGLRVPGAWDPFELAIRAILGQQVTVKGASTLAGRLVEKYGEDTAYGRLFPSADALARADLSSAGLPRTRANSIRGMAEAFASAAPPQTIEDLVKLPGVGHWTGQYIAMRAFNEPDAFPSCDLGLVKAAGRDVATKAEAWRPWRAYAAMHLWMNL
jgi:AraC family transcriptional regulator of adaptative response / DNA-3-methyladenine glycosylase II